MATNNVIALTALASYNGHQVVVPFVNDSQFFGYKMSSDDTQTLALYSTTIWAHLATRFVHMDTAL